MPAKCKEGGVHSKGDAIMRYMDGYDTYHAAILHRSDGGHRVRLPKVIYDILEKPDRIVWEIRNGRVFLRPDKVRGVI